MDLTAPLSYSWALALCYAAGFRGRFLTQAVAIMCAESGRKSLAFYVNSNLSVDRGLFQINDRAHPLVTDEKAFDPIFNVAYAYRLAGGGADFTPWSAYNSGSYLKFIPLVLAAKLRPWKWRVSHIDEEFGK